MARDVPAPSGDPGPPGDRAAPGRRGGRSDPPPLPSVGVREVGPGHGLTDHRKVRGVGIDDEHGPELGLELGLEPQQGLETVDRLQGARDDVEEPVEGRGGGACRNITGAADGGMKAALMAQSTANRPDCGSAKRCSMSRARTDRPTR